MARRPLVRLVTRVVKKMKEGLSDSAKLLENKVRENAGLTDHKLDALEKLGHPYSVRDTQSIHEPDFQVHKQTGRLDASIAVKEVRGQKDTIFVGVDDDAAPYVRHVIRGTSFMVARDFITGSFNEINDQLTRIFASKLKQGEDASSDKTKAEQ